VEFEIGPENQGTRLDHFLTEQLVDVGRSRIQQWIRNGHVLIETEPTRASKRLSAGDRVEVHPQPPSPLKAFPEDISIDILYEDDNVVAVNKPAGMVVHSGAVAKSGTLVNALLYHFTGLSKLGGDLRPGVVHRLDKMTSGVLLVAKHDKAHQVLANQFQSRSVRKIYWAIVHGQPSEPPRQGRPVEIEGRRWSRLEMPICRDVRQRIKMTTHATGREAETNFRVMRSTSEYSLLEVRIRTGRTHQIRVHLAKIGHAIVGDRLYGAPGSPKGLEEITRFYLHASSIGFCCPKNQNEITIQAPLPREFTKLLEQLGL
jgi:23S rRNA pseudouridine1911/1915/1917 synthase